MNLLLGLRIYFSLFGIKGVLLAAKARVFKRPVVATVSVPYLSHPIHLRLRTSDVTLFRSIILEGEYDWPLAKSPRAIVDAGANIGLTSIFYANEYPEAYIIAIEPEPSNYSMLLKNAANYRNIKPVQAALWHKNEDVHIIDRGIGCWAFQTADATGGSTDSKSCGVVVGITLDRLLSDFHIDKLDLLKVDIEGSEKEVFENSALWIDRVGAIAIELHDGLKAGSSCAVHLATKNMDAKYRRGETAFLLRKEYVVVAGRNVNGHLERQREDKRPSSSPRIIHAETL